MNDIQAASAGPLRPDAPIINDIAHLGGRGTLFLLALVQAHKTRQRVAPTQDAAAAVLQNLHALGVVRSEYPSQPGSHLTPIDKLPWSYTWSHVPFEELEARLTGFLANEGRSPRYAETWLSIWQELIPAEVIAYLQHQLRIHRFSDTYLEEVSALLLPNESRYCLGHWRYACWSAARAMASVALQHPGNNELLKFTLRNELLRRVQIASEAPGEKLCFSPSHSIPASALSSVLSRVATRLEDNFWKSPPAYNLL